MGLKNFNRIQYKDIVASICSKKLYPDKNIEIQVANLHVIAFRDLIECYLYLSCVKSWRWVDFNGDILNRNNILQSFLNVLLDLLKWLILYVTQLKKVAQASRQISCIGILKQRPSSLLFLRTDHWFNVESGGSVGHLSGVIDGFRRLGHRTHVVSTDRLVGVTSDKDFYLCEPCYEAGRNLPEIPELLYNNQLLTFIDLIWQNCSPSFIYQRYSLGNYTGELIKQKYKVPYICEYNGSFPWVAKHWSQRKLFHEELLDRIEVLNLHGADLIVVVSKVLFDELVQRGVAPRKILINPNGVDPIKYHPNIVGMTVRQKYNINRKIVVGMISTFGKWHGTEILAKSIKHIIDKNKNIHFLLIGDGLVMPEVRNIIEKDDVLEHVTLSGNVPQQEAPQYLAACDIFVSPHVPNPDGTPFFGSPTKLFEYMAMGRAIIASDLEQIGEILQHNENALLTSPGDVKGLASEILKLAADQSLRDRLSKKARADVCQKHTWQMNVEKVLERLESLKQ